MHILILEVLVPLQGAIEKASRPLSFLDSCILASLEPVSTLCLVLVIYSRHLSLAHTVMAIVAVDPARQRPELGTNVETGALHAENPTAYSSS